MGSFEFTRFNISVRRHFPVQIFFFSESAINHSTKPSAYIVEILDPTAGFVNSIMIRHNDPTQSKLHRKHLACHHINTNNKASLIMEDNKLATEVKQTSIR